MRTQIQFSHVPTIVFTMGVPGAGKSTWLRKNLPNYRNIGADEAKRFHPDYNSKRPDLVHDWSKNIGEQWFNKALGLKSGLWAIDGTGANLEKIVYRIEAAKNVGFFTVLAYIECDLETALMRNAFRTRTIPDEIVLEKERTIDAGFQSAAFKSDYVISVQN